MSTIEKEIAERLQGTDARLVVLCVFTNDDRLAVSVVGTGCEPDLDELEDTFADLLDNLRGDLNFVKPAGQG